MNEHATGRALQALGIDTLNEMQQQALGSIPRHREVILLSPTGSGKTLAFLLPVLQLLKTAKHIQCLVLTPSHELALQILQVWKKMATGYKADCFYGGHYIETELNSLAEPPALLIGTPGRIADHLRRQSIDTGHIHTLVLDEFDKSLALGFEEDMDYIISQLHSLHRKVLVSATEAESIPEFTGILEPLVLNYLTGETGHGLELRKVISPEKDKIDTLYRLLCQIGAEPAIVFCNHREATERVADMLTEAGIDTAVFHGGMEQPDREQALARFRNGSVHYLIATDLAARGLDISGLKHIIHYHLPGTAEEFTHRNGRTARMGASGTAYILLHAEENGPDYLPADMEELAIDIKAGKPEAPTWTTLYITGGKKDKISKGDIAGFFMKVGNLDKDDLGMIEIKDQHSFAAVKRGKIRGLLKVLEQARLKGKKYRIGIAR